MSFEEKISNLDHRILLPTIRGYSSTLAPFWSYSASSKTRFTSDLSEIQLAEARPRNISTSKQVKLSLPDFENSKAATPRNTMTIFCALPTILHGYLSSNP